MAQSLFGVCEVEVGLKEIFFLTRPKLYHIYMDTYEANEPNLTFTSCAAGASYIPPLRTVFASQTSVPALVLSAGTIKTAIGLVVRVVLSIFTQGAVIISGCGVFAWAAHETRIGPLPT